MRVTPTQLRKNLFKLLDQVVETGKPIEINRNGIVLRIVPQQKSSKLQRLKKHRTMQCDPEMIIENDWEEAWHRDLPRYPCRRLALR